MPQIRILTFNCLGMPVPLPGLRRRLAALGRSIAATYADLACLQEVGRWRYVPVLRHDEGAWPDAVAIEHPYAPKGGLLTLSKLPVAHIAYHPFQERGRVASLHATERHQAKGVLATTLVHHGQTVALYNTHLAANYSAQWSYSNPYAKVERSQLREIAELVRAVARDTLLIVAGDFNVPRGSWLLNEFRSAAELIDPLADSTEPTYRPLPGMPARAARALDHILVRPPEGRALQLSAELCFADPVPLAHGIQGFLSDHLGVQLTISWAARDATSDVPAARSAEAPLG